MFNLKLKAMKKQKNSIEEFEKKCIDVYVIYYSFKKK